MTAPCCSILLLLLLLMVVVQTDWKTPWNLRRRRRCVPSSSSFLAKTRPRRSTRPTRRRLHRRSVGTDFRYCSYFFTTEEYIKREREERENLRSKRLLFNGLSSTNRFTNFSKSRPPRISSSLCPPPQRDARFGEESCVVLSCERFLFRARACFLCVFARDYEDQSVLSFLSSLLLNSVKRRIYKKCAAERARQTSCSFSSLFWSLCFDFFIFLVVVLFFFSLLFSSLSLSLSLCCIASL